MSTFTRKFRVGERTVTLRVYVRGGKPVHCECEWDPDLPTAGLSAVEMAQYTSARDLALADMAKREGLELRMLVML